MTESRTFGSHRATTTILVVLSLLCPLLMCFWKLAVDMLFGVLAFAIYAFQYGVDQLNVDPTDILRSDILASPFLSVLAV